MRNQFKIGATTCVLVGLAGCGAFQATKDSAVDAAKWAFTTQIKTMNIDLLARSSLNPDSGGRSLSTVVRIYQLKTAKNFEKLDYMQLQRDDIDALKPDLLATKDIVLRPDANASISEAMNSEAEYVGVVAFFRDMDKTSQWKLILPKKQWKKTDPVKIEVRESVLELQASES
ncbi:type VI secretion protein [Herbaspirillum hiltneri N3]|uniref:Type VI secretion protein n=1 Tax=Herbaspirillum hiltneri N3 TaxID=1262470 RepID=A0ABN4I410_9BURK|nr:type VI secretion system lipoprotein TssJ [Herbaspirillum hiltneri]AKZ65497.1 type VI secretion protein [Herbaspirillum hiltneri N3]